MCSLVEKPEWVCESTESDMFSEHYVDVCTVTVGGTFELSGNGITAAVRVGMSDSLAVEEVVSMVEPSGNCAECARDAGAVGSY